MPRPRERPGGPSRLVSIAVKGVPERGWRLSRSGATALVAVVGMAAGAHSLGGQAVAVAHPTHFHSAGVAIGQPVPAVRLTDVRDYSATTLSLSDLKGQAVILDFWSVSCEPCVAMLPKLMDLEKTFDGQLRVVAISDDADSTVAEFLRLHPQFRFVSGRDTLGVTDSLFPHKYIPHYIWIDRAGILRAITGLESITAAHVRALVAGEPLHLPVKRDSVVSFDDAVPLLVDGNGGDASDLLYQSVLTRYNPGLGGRYGMTKGGPYDHRRVLALNVSIATLFQMAFSRDPFMDSLDFTGLTVARAQTRIETHDPLLLDVPDSMPSAAVQAWAPTHTYCYELIVPKDRAAQLQSIMREDLSRLFHVAGRMERHKIKVWAIVRRGPADPRTKGGTPHEQDDLYGVQLQNEPLAEIKWPLFKYLQQGTHRPVVYDVDLSMKVDLDIRAKLYDVSALRPELRKYGLDIEDTERTMDVLVLRDQTPT